MCRPSIRQKTFSGTFSAKTLANKGQDLGSRRPEEGGGWGRVSEQPRPRGFLCAGVGVWQSCGETVQCPSAGAPEQMGP